MINQIYNFIVYSLARLRAAFWGIFLKKIGKGVEIMGGVRIMGPQNVEIGNDVLINLDTKIAGQRGVKIGNHVSIGFNVNLVTQNHAYQDPSIPIKNQGYFGGPITIEDDVWLGANVVILPGVTVKKGSIVGANSVVSKDVEPYTIVGGIPAKLIKKRFEKAINE